MQHGGQVVVLDNGAGSIKLGFEGEANPRLVFPNCTAKAKGERQLYVGDGLLEARELGGMVVRRPHDRGFMVNYDLERDIWAKGFSSLAAAASGQLPAAGGGTAGASSSSSRSKAVLEFKHHSLLLTEPLFNFDAVRAATEEIVFEEFGFNSLLAAPAPFFSLHHICNIPVIPQPLPQQLLTIPGVPAPPAPPAPNLTAAEAALATYGAPVTPLSPGAVAAASAAKAAGAGVVVDLGFSACYVVPFYDGQLLPAAVRRLNLGGKALTNLLKETVSYRSLNMTDEGLLMERLKEQLCWVSRDVSVDLRHSNPAARSPHRRDVALPDGVHNLRGYVKPPTADMAAALSPGGKFNRLRTGPWPAKPQHIVEVEKKEAAERTAAAVQGQQQQGAKRGGGPAVTEQVLQLNNELFMVPEALFRPSDIGLQQAGLPEVVVQSVNVCPAGLAPLLYGQVVLTGGCCNLPYFSERFASELRSLVPDECELVVLAPQEPELTAWRGASAFAAGENYWQCVRTKRQYDEQGPAVGRRDR